MTQESSWLPLQVELNAGANAIAIDGSTSECRRLMRFIHSNRTTPDNTKGPYYGWTVLQFTVGLGLEFLDEDDKKMLKKAELKGTEDGDIEDFLLSLNTFLAKEADPKGSSILGSKRLLVVIYDYDFMTTHPTTNSLLSTLTDSASFAMATGTCVCLAAPDITGSMHSIIRDNFVCLDVPLPSTVARKATLRTLYKTQDMEVDDEHLDRLAVESAGLTMRQLEDAGSISIARVGEITPKSIRASVKQIIRSIQGVELLDTNVTFDDLLGMEWAKTYSKSLIKAFTDKPLGNPKGILLTGPPGTGKSYFGRCLGGEVGQKVVMISLSELKGKYVGESEKNLKRVLKLLETLAPCIAILDEVEKLFGQSGDGEAESGGVQSSMLQLILTWQAEREGHPVFVIATCNDFDTLPPEFSRDGRFNKRIWVGPYAKAERDALWDYYINKFQLKNKDIGKTPPDENWSGAEIQACVEDAYFMDTKLEEAAKAIVPVMTSMSSKRKQRMFTAASRACVDAQTGERVNISNLVPLPPPPPPPSGGTVNPTKASEPGAQF